jgi:cysteine-rich repeat protein
MFKNKKLLLAFAALFGAIIFLVIVLISTSSKNVEVLSVSETYGQSGRVYYISPSGVDTAAGTSTAPWKTFSKAMQTLQAGDLLNILPGTYSGPVTINANGTDASGILIKNAGGGTVLIDGTGVSGRALTVSGSHLKIIGIEVANSSSDCVDVTGADVVLESIKAHDCYSMGIQLRGQNQVVRNSEVFKSSMNNVNEGGSGWGSGIKVKVGGDNILIENNLIYNNWGEGLAVTRGKNVIVRNNVAYDNYSVNFYIDNSINTLLEKNFSYCHSDTIFKRDGTLPSGIAIGEEFYEGWGAQLDNVKITNNISVFCNRGIIFYGSDVGGSLKNTTIAYNTFWGSVGTAMSFEPSPSSSNIVIMNNIVGQAENKHLFISNKTGYTLTSNMWANRTSAPTDGAGTGDKFGDVKFAVTPGLTADSFKLSSTSPAINAATKMTNVTDDFSSKNRFSATDLLSDIGAFEYGTTVVPPAPVCGNFTKETGELCDDGNLNNNDQCSNDCKQSCISPAIWNGSACILPVQATCGNSLIEGSEICDDGNTSNNDSCSFDCKNKCALPQIWNGTSCINLAICGNNLLETGEVCDDGNSSNGDSCSADCKLKCVSPEITNGISCAAAPVSDITINVTSPAENQTFAKGTRVKFVASVSASKQIKKVEFYVDNKLICADFSATYDCSLRTTKKQTGTYKLKVIGYDIAGNAATIERSFQVQ